MLLRRSTWIGLVLALGLASPLAAQPVAPVPGVAAKPSAAAALPPAEPDQALATADAATTAAIVLAAVSLLAPSLGLGGAVPASPLLLPALAGAIAAAAMARDLGWEPLERLGAFVAGALGGGVVGLASIGAVSQVALRNLAGMAAAIAFAADSAVAKRDREVAPLAVH